MSPCTGVALTVATYLNGGVLYRNWGKVSLCYGGGLMAGQVGLDDSMNSSMNVMSWVVALVLANA